MSRNGSYRNQTCGYCGKLTGNAGEGEHVVPANLYSKSTPSHIQRLKIPSCVQCNDLFQPREAFFRSIAVMSGLRITPERKEMWEKAKRALKHPRYGKSELSAVTGAMVESNLISATTGSPYIQFFPHLIPDFCFIARKIVRGLTFSRCGQVIPDENVVIGKYDASEDEEEFLTPVYNVPNIFESRAAIFADDERFPQALRSVVHSMWQLKIYELRLTCFVTVGPAADFLGKTA